MFGHSDIPDAPSRAALDAFIAISEAQLDWYLGTYQAPLGARPASSTCEGCGAPTEPPTNFGRFRPACSYCRRPQ